MKKNKKEIEEGPVEMGVRIREIEKRYKARYVGKYGLPDREGPDLLFYTDKPEVEKGHDNYFVIGRSFALVHNEVQYSNAIIIANGKSIRDAVFPAIQLADGSMLVSRSQHDYVTGPNGEMLDGGCAYVRYNPEFPPTHRMQIINGVEVFTPNETAESPYLSAAPTAEELERIPRDVLHERFHDRALNGVSQILLDVGSFHLAADQPVRYIPKFPSPEEVKFRLDLHDEETTELHDACAEQDIVKVADALTDLIYVIAGMALHFGIALERVWEEVHSSNMTKIDPVMGKVIKRADGKVLKPQSYRPPNVRKALGFDENLLAN